jgi:hypothetical protein
MPPSDWPFRPWTPLGNVKLDGWHMANETSAEDSSFSKDTDPLPDAQGQAALLLIESLIHSLLDNGALTKDQALEAIDSATAVKEESAGTRKEAERTLRKSLGLLTSMRLSIDAHSGRYDEEPGAGPQANQRGGS